MRDALMSVRELQNFLQLDRTTIYSLLKSNQLPGFKVGGQWRFSQQDIDLWLQEQKIGQAVSPSPSSSVLPLYYIQSIQDIFAEALRVGSIVTHLNGEPLTQISNSCDFCDLILSTPQGFQRCADSWRSLAAHPEPQPELCECHAGLLYSCARIEVENQFVAMAFAGQIGIDGQLAKPSSKIDQVAATCGLDPARLHGRLSSVRSLTGKDADRLMDLLDRLGAILSRIGQERFVLLRKLNHIAEITSL